MISSTEELLLSTTLAILLHLRQKNKSSQSLKMAATWRLLPTTRFRSPKLQKEIICDQILCDFGRLIEADEEQFIQGVSHAQIISNEDNDLA